MVNQQQAAASHHLRASRQRAYPTILRLLPCFHLNTMTYKTNYEPYVSPLLSLLCYLTNRTVLPIPQSRPHKLPLRRPPLPPRRPLPSRRRPPAPNRRRKHMGGSKELLPRPRHLILGRGSPLATVSAGPGALLVRLEGTQQVPVQR